MLTQQQQAAVDARFSHCVQSDEGKVGMISGTLYMIGTRKECLEYQLREGIRAKTQVVPFN